jgi:glutamyl-tRNA(Gln) amidotransferase subunit D
MAKEAVGTAGDVVEIHTEDAEYIGTILPSPDESIVLLKLPSGYNTGIAKKSIKKIVKTGHKAITKFPEAKAKQKKNLPGISMIITGGTISSRLDYETGAVKWLMKPENILALSPKLSETVKINKIEKPFMIASENMSSEHWKKIAETAAKLLNKKENKGIIITHGTDTLHYTAAALSFMLKNLNKPVVLTYSQRSTDRGSTDTVLNLTCAGYAAISDIAQVMLVGHASLNDNFCYALNGTKVRKMHTSRRDTFRPINDVPIAKIHEDGRMEKLKIYNLRDEKKKVVADTAFEDKIALIKYFPGANPGIIDYFIANDYKGLIIEATGLGHVGTEEAKNNWLPSIKKAIDEGMIICFAPQTPYGKLDPYVYTPARKLLDAGVIYLEDILPETAFVKLGWVLGHEKNKDKIKSMILTNYANEFNSRLSEKAFLF